MPRLPFIHSRHKKRTSSAQMSVLEWLKTITFYEIAVGMKATLMHLIHYHPVTIQYPHEKRPLPE